MVQTAVSEMINGVVRIKWWKYRYVVLVALVVNIVLVNHFFFESSFTEFIRPPPPPGSEAALGQTPAPPPNGAIPPKPSLASASAVAEPAYTFHPSAPLQEVIALDKVPPTTPRKLSLTDYDFNGPYIGWPL